MQTTLSFSKKSKVENRRIEFAPDAVVEHGILPVNACVAIDDIEDVWKCFYPPEPTNVNPFNPSTFVKRRTAQFVHPCDEFMAYVYGGSSKFCTTGENKAGEVPIYSLNALPPCLAAVKEHAETTTGAYFSQALLNFYKKGTSLAFHADNLGPHYERDENTGAYVPVQKKIVGKIAYRPLVWGASFGIGMSDWKLQFRKMGSKEILATIDTPHNSYQFQQGRALQALFEHAVDAKKVKGLRLNMTLRAVDPVATLLHNGISDVKDFEAFSTSSVAEQKVLVEKMHALLVGKGERARNIIVDN